MKTKILQSQIRGYSTSKDSLNIVSIPLKLRTGQDSRPKFFSRICHSSMARNNMAIITHILTYIYNIHIYTQRERERNATSPDLVRYKTGFKNIK